MLERKPTGNWHPGGMEHTLMAHGDGPRSRIPRDRVVLGLIAATLLLAVVRLDMTFGRTLQQAGKLSVLDISQPSGYNSEQSTDRRPVNRTYICRLLGHMTARGNPAGLSAGDLRVLGEALVKLDQMAWEALWVTHRLLDDLPPQHLDAYQKILDTPIALNSAYRAEWPWIGEHLPERLVPPAGQDRGRAVGAPPRGWDPRTDARHAVWKRVFDPHDFHFPNDPLMEARFRVFVVSLLGLSAHDVRAMSAGQVARLAESSQRLMRASLNLENYWHLVDGWVVESLRGRSPEGSDSDSDIDFVALAEAFRKAKAQLGSDAPLPAKPAEGRGGRL